LDIADGEMNFQKPRYATGFGISGVFRGVGEVRSRVVPGSGCTCRGDHYSFSLFFSSISSMISWRANYLRGMRISGNLKHVILKEKCL